MQVYVQSSFQQSESGDYASSATKIWECDATATPVCSLFGGSQDFGFGDYAPETLSENLFAASAYQFQGKVAGIVAPVDPKQGGFKSYETLSYAKFAVVEGIAVIIHSAFPGTRAFDANAAEWISLTVSGANTVTVPVLSCDADDPDSECGVHFAVATLGVQVYVFGGIVYGDAVKMTDTIVNDQMSMLTLDVASKSGVWSSISKASPWPEARYGHGFSAFGSDTLLLFGGWAGSQPRNDLWMFTVSSESWQELSPAAPAPSARRFFGSAVVDSTLFVVGGDVSATESETSAVDDVWAWDGLR